MLHNHHGRRLKVKVARLCLTLCDLMDCNSPGSSARGDSPGKNTGVGCHGTPVGWIFLTQGLNPGLLHCRQIFLPYELPEKPKNTGKGSSSLLQTIFLTQESYWGLLHCRQILYQLTYQRRRLASWYLIRRMVMKTINEPTTPWGFWQLLTHTHTHTHTGVRAIIKLATISPCLCIALQHTQKSFLKYIISFPPTMYSFNKYLLSTYYVPNTVLGAWDTSVNKIGMWISLSLRSL